METFVLRIYVPTDGAAFDLHGVVEHVGSGRAERFHDSVELVARVVALLATPDGDGERAVRERPPIDRERRELGA